MQEYENLKRLVTEAEDDVNKAVGGNKAAGTRVRKKMQEIKAAATDIRKKFSKAAIPSLAWPDTDHAGSVARLRNFCASERLFGPGESLNSVVPSIPFCSHAAATAF